MPIPQAPSHEHDVVNAQSDQARLSNATDARQHVRNRVPSPEAGWRTCGNAAFDLSVRLVCTQSIVESGSARAAPDTHPRHSTSTKPRSGKEYRVPQLAAKKARMPPGRASAINGYRQGQATATVRDIRWACSSIGSDGFAPSWMHGVRAQAAPNSMAQIHPDDWRSSRKLRLVSARVVPGAARVWDKYRESSSAPFMVGHANASGQRLRCTPFARDGLSSTALVIR